MSNFTATTKLMQVGSERESLLSLRNLKIKSRLQKEREELNKAFKDRAERQQQRRQTGANALLGLAGGGAGIGIIRRFRPRKPSPTTGSGTRRFRIFRTKPTISSGGRVNTNILRNGSKLNSLLTVAFTGYDFLDRRSSGQTNVQAGTGAVATTGGAIAGGTAGAKLGALIGSFIVPGAGTVVGGALGGILGSFIGATTGGNIADTITGANEETRRKLELKKIDLQKGSTLFGSALDKFDVVLDKFEKLRQDDFDRTRTRDSDFAIPARRGGLRGFIDRFARPKPPAPLVPTAEAEFDVADLTQKPRNLKETLQRDLYILKRIPYGELLKKSVDQTIKEYVDAFTDPTNILINLLLIKFAGGRGVGKVKIPRNLINVTPGSIKNPFPNLGGSRIVIPNTSSGSIVKPNNIPFFVKPQFINKNVTRTIEVRRQIRRINFKTNKVLDDNRRIVRQVRNKKFLVDKVDIYDNAIRNLMKFSKEMSTEAAKFKNNKELTNAYFKSQRRISSQIERYRNKVTNISLQEIDKMRQGEEIINKTDIEYSRFELMQSNMLRKIVTGDPMSDAEMSLYKSYRNFLEKRASDPNFKVDTEIIDFFNLGPTDLQIPYPKGAKVSPKKKFKFTNPQDNSLNDKFFNSQLFKRIKKFYEKTNPVNTSFNVIQEGNQNTNVSIDNSSTIAMFGGGSSINMMEINGYMSV
tara:strand:+ start:7554 stop:9638 length:2085 start_codon:yes stop_codon:yes gene_type:complete